ncbi:hypothetical protein IV102_23810 [bacterium]|nr:hypothetical protein [bacterium]
MSKYLPLLFLGLGRLALAQTDPVRLVQPVSSRAIAPGCFEVRIQSQVMSPLTAVPQVPVVYSYLRLVAPLRVRGLMEDNLLDSFYAVDLNGNRILDQVSVDQRDGGVRLDMMKVETVGARETGPQAPYREDGRPKRYFLDPDCPEFMVLFYDPPRFGLELQHHGYRPTVDDMPNPSLQVMICEPCVGPSGPRDLCGEPDFKVSFSGPAPEQHLMFNWEPEFFQAKEQMPQWLRVSWFSVPLKAEVGTQETVFQVDCSSDSNPVYLLAQVNYAQQPGVRLRTPAVWQQLWNGSNHPAGR